VVAKRRQKVVFVELNSKFTTIHARLRSKLTLPPGQPFELSDVLRQFEGLDGAEKPVLVVELDSTATAEAVSQEVTILCCENEIAHGIIVLGDSATRRPPGG